MAALRFSHFLHRGRIFGCHRGTQGAKRSRLPVRVSGVCDSRLPLHSLLQSRLSVQQLPCSPSTSVGVRAPHKPLCSIPISGPVVRAGTIRTLTQGPSWKPRMRGVMRGCQQRTPCHHGATGALVGDSARLRGIPEQVTSPGECAQFCAHHLHRWSATECMEPLAKPLKYISVALDGTWCNLLIPREPTATNQ